MRFEGRPPEAAWRVGLLRLKVKSPAYETTPRLDGSGRASADADGVRVSLRPPRNRTPCSLPIAVVDTLTASTLAIG